MMLTDYNPQDAERLQLARLARFQAFVVTNLIITVNNDCLILQGADPSLAITQANTLLCQAAIILGTSKLEIFGTDSKLVFAAELKSEQIHISEEAMTAVTAARSVEFELSQSPTMPVTIPWNRIAAITGETEDELRSRLQASGTPFYWSDDGWAVDGDMAGQLVIRFRTEQGQKEAAMLLGEENNQQPSQEATNGHKPKNEKPEFRPLKKGAGTTLEKYLSFVSDNESRQVQILADIVDENTKGKRHVNKILAAYPDDMEKPKPSEFFAAAKRLATKRSKAQGETEAAETEEAPRE
ncbi:hypothetical protein A6S26_05565 [Nostoc sp. ATCC 43529]|nr:hypothetical protein A6S26_05565 [Nostoc sp. ATCC 43529]